MIKGKPIGINTFVAPNKENLKGFVSARKIRNEFLMNAIDRSDSAVIFTGSTLVLFQRGEMTSYDIGQISNRDIDTKHT